MFDVFFYMFKYGTGIASRRLSCIQEVYVLLTSVMTPNILKIMLQPLQQDLGI